MSFRSPFGQFLFSSELASIDLAVDGSTTERVFVLPGFDESRRIVINDITFNMSTLSAPRISGFGDNASSLPNGLFYESDLENNEPYVATFTDNQVLFGFASSIQYVPLQAGQQFTKIQIGFRSAEPVLNFGAGGYARMTVRDNVAAYCDSLTVFVAGYYVNTRGSY